MKKLLLALALLFITTPSWAQCNGVFQPGQICGNAGASPALPKPSSLSGFPGPLIDVANASPPIVCNGTDQSSNLTTLLSALQTAGTGGTLVFHACTYQFNNPIIFPNTNTPPTGGSNPFPTQVSFKFLGATGLAYGIANNAPSTFGGTIFDLRGTDPLGQIQTYGVGLLVLQDLTLTSGINSNGVPFFFSTYTTVWANNIAGIGSNDRCNTATPPNQDLFVMGGTNPSQATHNTNNPYQAYNSNFTNIFTNRMRRIIYGRTFSNHLKASGLTAWPCSGSNLKGAISLTSIASGGTGYAALDILTVSGGTVDTVPQGVPARIIVDTVSSGVITAAHVYELGDYTTAPTNPVSVTGGLGTGATFNLNWQLDGVAVENQGYGNGNTVSWDIHTNVVDFCGYAYAARTNGLNGLWRLSIDDPGCAGSPVQAGLSVDAGGAFNVLSVNQGGTSRVIQDQSATPTSGCSNNNIISASANLTDFSCFYNFNATAATLGKVLITPTPATPVTIQPLATTGGGSTLFQMLLAAADGGGNIFNVQYNGQINLGSGTQAGTIVNSSASGASFLSNARLWTNNGNGTGFQIRANDIAIFNNANTQIMDVGCSNVVGLCMGTTVDTAMFRTAAGQITFGNLLVNSQNGQLIYAQWTPGVTYSAAGTAVPTCNAAADGTRIYASDITTATYRAAYVSGGTNKGALLCINGTGWVSD